MMDKYKTTVFKDAICKEMNDLPDHVMQEVNDLTAKLMLAALTHNEGRVDPNLSLAGLQKALALIIAKFFPTHMIDQVCDSITIAIRSNAKEWADFKLPEKE